MGKCKIVKFHEYVIAVKAGEGGPRMNIPSDKWGRGQNVCPIDQGDVSRGSIDKDMHHRRIGGMGARKYLREGCCHYIKCSATNFLIAFMWRKLLNSAPLVTLTHKG